MMDKCLALAVGHQTVSNSGSARDLNLSDLGWQLQQAGWDILSSELGGRVAARRERVPGSHVWTMVIDRHRNWRFTVTRALEPAAGRVLVRGGHVVHVLREQQQVVTMAGRLEDQADLPGLLVELAQLALEETGVSAHPAEGTTPWEENSAPGATSRR
jgi:hypothetical protein